MYEDRTSLQSRCHARGISKRSIAMIKEEMGSERGAAIHDPSAPRLIDPHWRKESVESWKLGWIARREAFYPEGGTSGTSGNSEKPGYDTLSPAAPLAGWGGLEAIEPMLGSKLKLDPNWTLTRSRGLPAVGDAVRTRSPPASRGLQGLDCIRDCIPGIRGTKCLPKHAGGKGAKGSTALVCPRGSLPAPTGAGLSPPGPLLPSGTRLPLPDILPDEETIVLEIGEAGGMIAQAGPASDNELGLLVIHGTGSVVPVGGRSTPLPAAALTPHPMMNQSKEPSESRPGVARKQPLPLALPMGIPPPTHPPRLSHHEERHSRTEEEILAVVLRHSSIMLTQEDFDLEIS